MYWISVKEILPEDEGYYLVVIKGYNPFTAEYSYKRGWFDDTESDEYDNWDGAVTHWMPLPEQPK